MENGNHSRFESDQVKPDPTRKIHWADAQFDQEVETLKSRNWITETMIQQYGKLWHCDRAEVIERLTHAEV